MKTALEILKETHEELSKPNPADWKAFDEIMNDGTGEAMLRAMERYADQFKQPHHARKNKSTKRAANKASRLH